MVQEFLKADRRELRDQMRNGYAIDPAALAGFTYHGISLGLPRWVEKLSWKKFMKVFYQEADTQCLRGWNVRAADDDLTKDWSPKIKNDRPVTFGHYHVVDAYVPHVPEELRHGLLIDYSRGGRGGNGALNHLRDPIVALAPDSVDTLLGWSYMALGQSRIPTPSYFLLTRGDALESPEPDLD
jgi:hypothetical protein